MSYSEILSVIRAQEEATARSDALGIVKTMATDVVVFDLPPPLVYRNDAARNVEGLNGWLATWDGGVTVRLRDPQIMIDGDLAVVFGLSRMVGKKVDGNEVDTWSRRTVVLQQIAGSWKIVHDHLSFPLAMDGSNHAVTDLNLEGTERLIRHYQANGALRFRSPASESRRRCAPPQAAFSCARY